MIFAPFCGISQEKKPKVALVLSGGGAKGIAHISTLQRLDSLGIVPDLIVGTSMGSVVGGLYAMGYSGDSIAALSKHTDWKVLFGGAVGIKDVSNEEKSEFGKYLLSFEIDDGKPKPILSFINDQNLREFFSIYTLPVFDIDNFDELPIPYRAIATDIVNGKEVVLSGGSLGTTMRASMSIPGVFSPIKQDDALLVDGGVLNNFPTDVAKNMGADIIIGSDVGGGMQPIEKLDNITTILFQTAMLSSNLKSPENAKMCDIFIDHVPNLTYSTADFERSTEIYEQGKLAVDKNIDKLVELSLKLKKFKQRKHQLPIVPNELFIDTIEFKGVSQQNMSIVKSRVNLKLKQNYTMQDLIGGVHRAMGTNLFDEIYFSPFAYNDKMGLRIEGVEKARHQVKTAIHFSSHRGAGIIVNYTGRNIFGNSSRFLVSLDIAQQPRARIQYQKNFGEEKKWWWRTETYGQNLDQDVYFEGELASGLKNTYFIADTEFNRNLNSLRSYVGLGMDYNYSKLKSAFASDPGEDQLLLKYYKYRAFDIYAQASFNTLNKVFYATKGTAANVKVSRPLLHEAEIATIHPVEDVLKGSTNGYTKLTTEFEQRFRVNEKVTAILGFSTGFTFIDELKQDQVSFVGYGYGGYYFLGGSIMSPRKSNFVFPGLNEDELAATQFMMAELGLQYNLASKLYLTPHINIASVGFAEFDEYIKHAFSPSGNWEENLETSAFFSAGITTSYNSIIGPIDFDISYVNGIDKVRFFVGVGIQFNRSN